MKTPRVRLIVLVGVIGAFAVAIPVMGADPSPSANSSPSADPSPSADLPSTGPSPSADLSPSTGPSPSAQAAPSMTAEPDSAPNPDAAPNANETPKPDKSSKSDKAAKAPKDPEIAVTVTGTVVQSTDGKGRPTFTLTAGGTTWELSAGPPWYWGTNNPLAAYAGKSVTVVGTYHEGDSDLDVDTIDGKAIRAAGKPPWAGGPWVVGSSHPGWKDWMTGGKPGNGLGRENAPGQNKDTTTGG